jgi:hypothetical protein
MLDAGGYVRHNAWSQDGALLRGAAALAEIPGKLVHGRFDFQAPLENAYALSRAWPRRSSSSSTTPATSLPASPRGNSLA